MFAGKLFCGVRLNELLARRRQAALKEISRLSAEMVSGRREEDIASFYSSKMILNVPAIGRPKIRHWEQERRAIMDSTSTLVFVDVVEVRVPFDGSPEVFGFRPSRVRDVVIECGTSYSELVFHVERRGEDQRNLRKKIDDVLDFISESLAQIRKDVLEFSARYDDEVRQAVQMRVQKLRADQNFYSGLGFELMPREGAPSPAVVPLERRPAPLPQYPDRQCDPALADADYCNILALIGNMARVMELSPSVFTRIGEEDLRWHFLVQLNSQYVGRANAEVFNYRGKTDILIKHGDANLFIAECKYWNGGKKFREAIDQLVRYITWRDTKTAIILFSKNRDFTRVLREVVEATQKHELCASMISQDSESVFRFEFKSAADADRRFILSVLVFNVPDGV